MGTFYSDNLLLHFDSQGSGHPMVLVHGWGSSSRGNWADTGWVEALLPHRRVICLDCRGHGKSDKPHHKALYSYAAMSRDVVALMDHLGIETADYLGYSMGAFMGAALLGSHADRFSSLVLGGIGMETEESAAACVTIADALRAPSVDAIEDPLGRAYRRFVEADPDSDLEALALSALQMWPEGDPLALIGAGAAANTCPVLIVNGTEDLPYARSNSLLSTSIGNLRIHEIPGADHLTAVSDPAFKQAVLAFINRGGERPQ